MKSDILPDTRPQPDWLPPLLKVLSLESGDSNQKFYDRANRLASVLAPDTRRLWSLILVLEAVAVLLPLLWLMVAHRDWNPSLVAVSIALTTVAVLGFCWWMRWRRQQHGWVRSRLLAEIARSSLATSSWDPTITGNALYSAPSIRNLAALMSPAPEAAEQTLDDIKQHYITHRIDDQLAFFEKKARQASIERRKLSRYVTWSLDGALILAVLGLWLGFSEKIRWILSVSNIDLVLALAGAALPLTAILVQSLSAYLDLNRRTGRYAQQWEFLHSALERIRDVGTKDDGIREVVQIEQALLSEVVEWFYQNDHAEIFYHSTAAKRSVWDTKTKITDVSESFWSRAASRLLASLGIALGFAGRVIFGRLLIIAVTSVLTALLIFSRSPSDPFQRSILRMADGRLLSKAGDLTGSYWNPQPRDTANGFILIAHGLHDSAMSETNSSKDDHLHWMSELKRAIQTQLKSSSPDICLVDWSISAKPSEVTALLAKLGDDAVEHDDSDATETSATQFVKDIVAIRAQAQGIGDIVGFRLANSLEGDAGILRSDRPMHFIGHSAGGFLVVRAALILKKFNLVPDRLRVTLLDTPLPLESELRELLSDKDGNPDSRVQVDFYKTSVFAQNVPEEISGFPNYRVFTLQPDAAHSTSAKAAHSYAHQWMIRTVTGEIKPLTPMGFPLSPFASP